MNLTEALEDYCRALDEAMFVEQERIRGWADSYKRLFDGRPWNQVEAAIRAEMAEMDAERVRTDTQVRMTRATLDVEMLKAQLQVASRGVGIVGSL